MPDLRDEIMLWVNELRREILNLPCGFYTFHRDSVAKYHESGINCIFKLDIYDSPDSSLFDLTWFEFASILNRMTAIYEGGL